MKAWDAGGLEGGEGLERESREKFEREERNWRGFWPFSERKRWGKRASCGRWREVVRVVWRWPWWSCSGGGIFRERK